MIDFKVNTDVQWAFYRLILPTGVQERSRLDHKLCVPV